MVKVTSNLNTDYLKKHAEDIINNTDVLLNPSLFVMLQHNEDPELRDIYRKMFEKHQIESGNWYLFGPGERFVGANESYGEALERIDREYCEKTGHWDLFEWVEMGD